MKQEKFNEQQFQEELDQYTVKRISWIKRIAMFLIIVTVAIVVEIVSTRLGVFG